ncbi:MAG: hypothetical protein J07HN4v3_01453 [Halonotius sp. J07HN4]|nr:MAG: hypothetical protein J07HN4v3_01453 [Halonotius sp. J07HN4]
MALKVAAVLQTLRESGPGLLVPAAWLVVAAAHRGFFAERSLLIAHLVMVGFIVFFLTTGWEEMNDRALAGWRVVMVVGVATTLCGVAGFLLAPFETPLLAVSLLGWMVLPAFGLLYTGVVLPEGMKIYVASGTLSIIGPIIYLLSFLLGVDLVAIGGIGVTGIGQTLGIGDAVLRY